MKAVIPAAGLGTRLLPVTKAQPKEMLPVADKPAIQYVVEEAVFSGIEDILIITGRGKRAIEDHFDRSYELESVLQSKGDVEGLQMLEAVTNLANIHYIRQKESKGLGDAIRCAGMHVGNEPFAVLLGDTLTYGTEPCTGKLLEVFERKNACVLAVERVPPEKISRYGVVAAEQIDDGLFRITDLVEKPAAKDAPSDLAIFGRYILTPGIFKCIDETIPGVGGEIQLTDALKSLLDTEEIYACEVQEHRFDIGNKLDWLKASIEMALLNPEMGPQLKKYLGKLLISEIH